MFFAPQNAGRRRYEEKIRPYAATYRPKKIRASLPREPLFFPARLWYTVTDQKEGRRRNGEEKTTTRMENALCFSGDHPRRRVLLYGAAKRSGIGGNRGVIRPPARRV